MTRPLRRLSVTSAAIAIVLAACGSSDDSGGSSDTTAAAAGGGIYGGDEPAATTAAASATTGAGGAAPATGDGAVAIKDFAFDPGDASVAAGTAVTWTNEDGAAHRIKSDDDSFNSDDLGQGDTFEHTFDSAGTFDYVCGIHPSMTGSITVTG